MDVAPPAPASPPSLPRDLGDYVLLEEIGRGGMGVIYKARQCCLDRLCAVKMLRPGPAPATPEAEASLRAEAAAAASLDHPNIVGIYEVGRADGQLFFSMEYVPGEDLSRYVRSRILDARTIASLTLRIAEAIAYAHARGVMHHDLKPANVVMSPDGEPQVTDFGLARRIDAAHRADPTRGAGSPNYLAPEQASARFGDPGPATDVFGLGAILYFLLTDRPPFAGVTLDDTLHAVLETEPVNPRALRQGLPLDLTTICLRCLQKQPARRYASAREVADELRRFLADEPVLARPAGLLERGSRLCRRHPVIATRASSVALLLALIAAGASLAAYRIHEARQQAEASERLTRRHLYDADLLVASSAFADGSDAQVRRRLQNHVPRPGQSDLRGWEWRFLHHASQGDATSTLGRRASAVATLQPTREPGQLIAGDVDGTLSLWDTRQPGAPLAEISLATVGVPASCLAPNANLLASFRRDLVGTNDSLVLLSLPKLEVLREFPFDTRLSAGTWTPDGASLWAVDAASAIRIDTASGKILARHEIQRARRSFDFAFSPDARWLAFADTSDRLSLLDLSTGRLAGSVAGHRPNPVWGGTYQCVRFSPDQRWIATSGADGTVRLWSVSPFALVHTLTGHADLVTTVAFAPDQSCVASAGRDGFIQKWPLDSRGQPGPPLQLRGADPVQTTLTLLPGAGGLVSGGIDGAIRLWPDTPTARLPILRQPPPGTAEVAPLANGSDCVARLPNAALRVAPIAGGPDHFAFDPPPEILAATVEHPGRGTLQLATLDLRGTVTVGPASEPVSRHRRHSLPKAPAGRHSAYLTFSPDCRWLAIADLARGFDIVATADFSTLTRRDGRPVGLVFSPTGRWLAAAEVGGALKIVDLQQPGRTHPALSHPQVSNLAFSHDESRLASAAFDGSIQIWDLSDGKPPIRIESGTSHLLAPFWAPDHSRLFVGNLSGSLAVWDLETLRESMVLRLHTQPITAIDQLPDGTLRTFAPDAIRAWPAPPPPAADGPAVSLAAPAASR